MVGWLEGLVIGFSYSWNIRIFFAATYCMEYNIGPYTDSFIKQCADEVGKKKTKDKIYNLVIHPILMDVFDRHRCKIGVACVASIVLLIALIMVVVAVSCRLLSLPQ